MGNELVIALQRGLDILAALNQPEVTEVRHLHALTGLPKATVVRLLRSLEAGGYVGRRPGGGYRVTAKVLTLSRGCDGIEQLLRKARPVLEWLRTGQTWPSDLAVFDHDAMVIVDTGSGLGTLSLNRSIGSRLPVMTTAFGRAHLAFCDDAERDAALARLRQSPDPHNWLARNEKATAALLEATRRRGYAICDREYGRTIRCVAMAIMVEGQVAGCINMMAMSNSMTMRQVERAFVPPLSTAAAGIARALGSGGGRG